MIQLLLNIRKQIYELLEIWLNQRGFNGGVKTAATAASWMIYGLTEQWNRDHDAESCYLTHFTQIGTSICRFTSSIGNCVMGWVFSLCKGVITIIYC